MPGLVHEELRNLDILASLGEVLFVRYDESKLMVGIAVE